MIPQFVLSGLYRKQITDFLALPYKTKATKAQLVQQLYTRITSNTVEYVRLLNAYPYELAVGPTEAQLLLQCTPTERRRWIREGKIPVLYYQTLQYPRVSYPVHERKIMMNITQQEIASWRIERRHQVSLWRSEAIIRSQEQKKFLHHVEQICVDYRVHLTSSRFIGVRSVKGCRV